MSFNKDHRAYADAVMKEEAAKLLKVRGVASSRDAAKASYNSSYDADRKLRPGSPNSWYIATANSVNSMIDSESKKAIKAAYIKLKKTGKVASSIESLTGMAATSIAFGVATAGTPDASAEPMMSRRSLLQGFGALAGATVVFGPTEAKADNYSYIGAVKRGVQSHVKTKAPAIVVSVGAGIRADLNSDEPKFVMQG